MGISTRPAVASDEEFVNALTRKTVRPYVQATWPSDEEREKYYWINRFQQNETEIIQVDGEDAGRITITRRPRCIVLEEIHIAPGFRDAVLDKCSFEKFWRKPTNVEYRRNLRFLRRILFRSCTCGSDL